MLWRRASGLCRWGALADSCGLVVAEPEQLGEDERGTTVHLEMREQVVDREVAVGGGCGGAAVGGERSVTAALFGAGTQLVDADPASDCENPRAGRRIAAEAAQRRHGSQEGLLNQVVRRLVVDQRRAQPPDILVARRDERIQRTRVTASRCVGEKRQPISHRWI